MIRFGVGVLVAAALCAPPSILPAQTAATREQRVRRIAIESVLLSRAERTGERLPVSLCSVLDAIGYAAQTIGESASIRAFIADDLSRVRCRMELTGRPRSEWSPHLSVIGVSVAREPVERATVTVEVWRQPLVFSRETYEFNVSPEEPWTPTRVREDCCQRPDAREPGPATPLVVLNGRPLEPGGSLHEVLAGLRGEIVDSVRVLSARDPAFSAYGRWGAVNGVIIIGTHTPSRRP